MWVCNEFVECSYIRKKVILERYLNCENNVGVFDYCCYVFYLSSNSKGKVGEI